MKTPKSKIINGRFTRFVRLKSKKVGYQEITAHVDCGNFGEHFHCVQGTNGEKVNKREGYPAERKKKCYLESFHDCQPLVQQPALFSFSFCFLSSLPSFY